MFNPIVDDSLIMLKHNILPLSDKRRIAFYSSLSGYQCFCSCESCCTRLITLWRVLFVLRAFILWHDVNKVLTENTPTAYLTGEARFAPLRAKFKIHIDKLDIDTYFLRQPIDD